MHSSPSTRLTLTGLTSLAAVAVLALSAAPASADADVTPPLSRDHSSYPTCTVTGQTTEGTTGRDVVCSEAESGYNIRGYAGVDHMVAQHPAANEWLWGGLGNDVYHLDSAGDFVVEDDYAGPVAGSGIDWVVSPYHLNLSNVYVGPGTSIFGHVEHAQLTGSSALSILGNQLKNWLVGNTADNTLTGLGGNDTLDGYSGADTLIGGPGDDAYYVERADDTVTELPEEGTDEIRVHAAAVTIPANVENARVASGAADITGNAMANRIVGGPEADTLDGGPGKDHLTGGAGADTFRITVTSDNDLVADFDIAADKIDVSTATTTPATWIGSKRFAGTGTPQVRFVRGKTNTVVQLDSDGDATTDGSLTLRGRPLLTQAHVVTATP